MEDGVFLYLRRRCYDLFRSTLLGIYAYYSSHLGIWMCRGRDMNVLVMDVEGTDGRERGEDQVRLCALVDPNHLIPPLRTSNASRRCFPLRRQKFSL